MKKRGIQFLIITLFSIGGYTIVNNTGDDIILESGVVLKAQDIAENLNKVYPDRDDSDCFKIIIHHTAMPKDTPISRVSEVHVENGWSRLSYHFGVLDDSIYVINDISKMTWHAKGSNKYGIGVVLLGNYQNDYPSEQTIKTLQSLISAIKEVYCIRDVVAHRDVRATLCPGDKAYECLINENTIE